MQENVIATGHNADASRRKKNNGANHANLLNVIDESVDAMRKFREFAIEIQQPWADMKAFLHDDNENPGEIEVRVSLAYSYSEAARFR